MSEKNTEIIGYLFETAFSIWDVLDALSDSSLIVSLIIFLDKYLD